ncbi:MAG: hypothetical protein IJ161_04005 [Bacteroidales bacterium]|nr:hypothetical protein [Bacteroidales bacterium]
MAVLMYIYAGDSFESAARSIEVVSSVFPFLGISWPTGETVREWVLKCGLDSIKRGEFKEKGIGDAYAVITDESITISGHKILVTLKVPARQGDGALRFSDVEVADIDVAPSHKSGDVKEAVERVTEREGSKPAYAVSDNGTNLVKGLGEAEILHHRDVGHTLGTFLKTVYGDDEEFKALSKSVGYARHFALTDVDYLMPCNMRAIARWMNLFDWVYWAKHLMSVDYLLTEHERKMYSFLQEHGGLVDELDEVMECYREILATCKNRGLSMETAKVCIDSVSRRLVRRGTRPDKLASLIVSYFVTETAKLEGADEVRVISSDVLESMFGWYKGRKSPNRMHGVTGFILTLPLKTKIGDLESSRSFDFKACMEARHRKDVRTWQKENLPESLATKRRNVLKNAC